MQFDNKLTKVGSRRCKWIHIEIEGHVYYIIIIIYINQTSSIWDGVTEHLRMTVIKTLPVAIFKLYMLYAS